MAAPDALRIAYETGRLNDASRGLSIIPIIDVRPYTDGNDDVHDIVASHITRARLIAANGHAGNQVFRTYAPGTPIQPARCFARTPLARLFSLRSGTCSMQWTSG